MHTLQNTANPKTFGPYSPVRQAGAWVFVSGQVGVDPLNGAIDHDPVKQTIQALENVRSLLGTVGLTMQHIVEATLFVTDMGDFKNINDAYSQFFTEPYPARACVAVKELPRVGGDVPVKVEVKVIALGDPA